MSDARPIHVAVIGGYRADEPTLALAEEVGRLFAEVAEVAGSAADAVARALAAAERR